MSNPIECDFALDKKHALVRKAARDDGQSGMELDFGCSNDGCPLVTTVHVSAEELARQKAEEAANG